MKIINLVKSEFVKNYSIKKLLIISFIMLIASILFTEANILMNYNVDNDTNLVKEMMTQAQRTYEFISKEENQDNLREIDLKHYEAISKLYSILVDNNAGSSSWQTYLVELNIIDKIDDNNTIEYLKEHRNDEYVKTICSLNESTYQDYRTARLSHFCKYFTQEELDKTYNDNKKLIEDYTNILKENKYYKYLEYELENNLAPDVNSKMAKIIIDNKIEDGNDYRISNYREYQYVKNFTNYSIIPYEEFKSGYNGKVKIFPNYEKYKEYYKNLEKEASSNLKIIEYSSLNNIRHDLSFNNEIRWQLHQDKTIPSSKSNVNLIFHLSIVVLVIVSITSGGIVSREHSSGTIKNIITAPVRRWKIILGKFVYLILHTYIIWFITLIMLSIYSGFRLGFSDLFTPKLIYNGTKVIEVNYYLYLIKDMLLAGIPIICFLSMLLFISVVSLNTALTTSISTMLSFSSFALYALGSIIKIKLVTFIPFLYFDSGFILLNSKYYTNILKYTNISLNKGIIISIITTTFLYIITNIIYTKRDIKN